MGVVLTNEAKASSRPPPMCGGRLAPPRAKASRSVALALLIVLISLIGPATSQGAFPGANGKIAFQTPRDGGGYQIYTMNADGSSQTRLTNNPRRLTDPGLVARRDQDRLPELPATATARSM